MMRELSVDEAKPIWDKFVPAKQVWTDDWDIRVALCKEYGYVPFILYDGKNFFPLQYEPENKFYSILGGTTSEKNYLTFDSEFMKTSKEIPENIYFDFLDAKFDGCVESACPQFFIDITAIKSLTDYMKRFSHKHRKNFKHAIKKFGSYEFLQQGTSKELAALNILTFKEKSDFVTEASASYDLLDDDSRTEYWSIVKDGKTAFIIQYFFYDTTMSVCVWGADRQFKDSLKVAFKESILLAKSRGCTRIDYAPTYSGWKFLYHLDTQPLWRYNRGVIVDTPEMSEYGIPAEERKKLQLKGRL